MANEVAVTGFLHQAALVARGNATRGIEGFVLIPVKDRDFRLSRHVMGFSETELARVQGGAHGSGCALIAGRPPDKRKTGLGYQHNREMAVVTNGLRPAGGAYFELRKAVSALLSRAGFSLRCLVISCRSLTSPCSAGVLRSSRMMGRRSPARISWNRCEMAKAEPRAWSGRRV